MIREKITLHLACLLAASHFLAGLSYGKEPLKRPPVKTPKLAPLFSDDFKSDTRSDYHVVGQVDFDSDSKELTLEEGAAVERSIADCYWTQMKLGIAPVDSSEEKQQAASLWFRLHGATDCCITLKRDLNAGQTTIQLIDTVPNNGGLVERKVRESIVNTVDWSEIEIEYRRGLVRVSFSGEDHLIGYIDNVGAVVVSSKVKSEESHLGLSQWSVSTQSLPRVTAKEQEKLAAVGPLFSRAKGHMVSRNYEEAIDTLNQLLAILKEVRGEDDGDYSTCLSLVARMHEQSGDHAKARRLYPQALKSSKRAYGDRHPTFAFALHGLASLEYELGEYEQALKASSQAVKVFKSALGDQPNRRFAITLGTFGLILSAKGEHARAEEELTRCLGMLKSTLGPRDPEVANCLGLLGSVCDEQGKFTRAKKFYDEAEVILRQVTGVKSDQYAALRTHLASHYRATGAYEQAESIYEELLKEYEGLDAEEMPPRYGRTLHELGLVYLETGSLAKAKQMLLEAARFLQSNLSKRHPNYLACLNSLAALYTDIGDFQRAEEYYLETLEAHQSDGVASPDLAAALNNVGLLYLKMGKLIPAEERFKRAIELDRSFPESHRLHLATSLSNLGMLYRRRGAFQLAKQCYAEAMQIRKELLGEQNYPYAQLLNNLGLLHHMMGEFPTAMEYFEESKSVRESLQGQQHPEYADCLNNLAKLCESMGNHEPANSLFKEALDLQLSSLERAAPIESARQQGRHLRSARFFLDTRVSHALANMTFDPNELAADLWRWKGSLTARQRAYRNVANNQELRPLFDQLQLVTQRLSVAFTQGSDSRWERWEERVKSLMIEREALEQRIAAASVEFQIATKPVQVEMLQSVLPDNAAFIDFLEYEHGTPDPKQAGKTIYEPRFLALVVRKSGPVKTVPLASANKLREKVNAFRSHLIAKRHVATRRIGADIRKLLWHDIHSHLEGVETAIISPDTILGLLPFNALPGLHSDTFLIEDLKIVMVPSAHRLQLLYARDEQASEHRGLLVVGDVDYDRAIPRASVSKTAKHSRDLSEENERLRRKRASLEGRWDPLPGFKNELNDVAESYRVRHGANAPLHVLEAAAATEIAFLDQASRYSALHVVTHGFFTDPEFKSLSQPERPLVRDLERNSSTYFDRWLPGMLSGLVMSGANAPPKDPSDLNDGILLASEIEAASLKEVDLVVLSACETGLGSVAGGEGLTSLQRAFHLAGADTVVASLWKIEDRTTQELMRRFYDNLWNRSLTKMDALREAQLWMLRHPKELTAMGVDQASPRGLGTTSKRVKTTQKQSNRTNPYFWAAFQLSGDWR